LKIALINVRFSANLGDGLLSECLEAELARQLPEASFVSVDLAGRTGYGTGAPWRRAAMQLLTRAPAGLRKRLAHVALQRVAARIEPRFAEALADCDAAILGGGNLLSDMDLNFPVKIAKALSAWGGRRPLAVFAVGVSRNWSAEGSRLFGQAFAEANLIHFSVRDQLSHEALTAQAPALVGREIAVVRDPGLLAAQTFAMPDTGRGAAVGLCITDPLALRYHGGQGSAARLRHWFGALIHGLTSAGHRVRLFTNGSPEDRHFLASNAARWRAIARDRVEVADEAATPAELVAVIAGCSLVIAHRMHACIAAHSLVIPTIGLRWDAKLDAFFTSAGRGEFLFTAGEDAADTVIAAAGKALAEGVDREAHARLLADARDDVAVLAAALRQGMMSA
jgi:polysaccharide pyruvyl transferase WcaK-like protein